MPRPPPLVVFENVTAKQRGVWNIAVMFANVTGSQILYNRAWRLAAVYLGAASWHQPLPCSVYYCMDRDEIWHEHSFGHLQIT